MTGPAIQRWLALMQYGFPFAIGAGASPVARFRALARSRYAASRLPVRLAAPVAMTLGWPFGAALGALQSWRRARADGRAYGLAELADMWWLAMRHSIPPLEYALYQFERPERRRRMGDYVYWNDHPALAALTRRAGAADGDVQDKVRFAQICTRMGYPHPATLAVFEGGAQRFPAEPFRPEGPALWTKAIRLKGGAGAAKWVRDGVDYRDKSGRRLAAGELAAEFAKRDLLVQPFLENHPAVAAVTNGSLAALRIVTGLERDDGAVFVTALIGLPHGRRDTSVAAILGAIDPDTGRVTRAAFPWNEPVERSPDTGAPVTGLQLPFWAESNSLVRRAHAEAFSKFPFLGWDVALTADGPVLLETNAGWGALPHQMLDGPLGDTAFARLVDQYV